MGNNIKPDEEGIASENLPGMSGDGGMTSAEEEEPEETDLDSSAGKLIIDLDFQSGEESHGGNGEHSCKSKSSTNTCSNSCMAKKRKIANESADLVHSDQQKIPAENSNISVIGAKNGGGATCTGKGSATAKFDRKNRKNNEKLKLKIKSRKMQTVGSDEIANCEKSNQPSQSPAAKKAKTEKEDEEKVERKNATTWVRTVSTTIDTQLLGPCQPGTHVSLDGVVWNETPGGLLVVNVTWRGRSYVGTLLDCTRYDWAAPRLCESPSVDGDTRMLVKGRNGKRPAVVSDLCGQRAQRQGSNNGHKNKQKSSSNDSNEEDNTSLAPISVDSQPTCSGLESMSPVMEKCPCMYCEKQFDVGCPGLKFHQNHSHRQLEVEKEDSSKLSPEESESLRKLFQVVGTGTDTKGSSLNYLTPVVKLVVD